MSTIARYETAPWSSTYRVDFQPCPSSFLPPLKYFQEPCLHPRKGKLPPRCFPISLPRFPNRPRDGNIPIAAGFQTLVHRQDQEKLNTKKKFDTETAISTRSRTSSNESIQGDVPSLILEEIVKLATYTPSSKLEDVPTPATLQKKARKLSAKLLTCNERESHPDTVQYRPVVYETRPEIWQQIGCYWDKVQTRPGCDEILGGCALLPVPPQQAGRLLNRAQVKKRASPVKSERKGSSRMKSRKAVRFSESETNRNKIPGYGGYIPQLPVTAKVHNRRNTEEVMQSMAQRTYREFSKSSYKPPEFGHNGPLSRTVTLTQPFNPFNKVERQEIVVP